MGPKDLAHPDAAAPRLTTMSMRGGRKKRSPYQVWVFSARVWTLVQGRQSFRSRTWFWFTKGLT